MRQAASRIPDDQRRSEALAILTLAKERLILSDKVQSLAESLEKQGLDAIDALHLAFVSSSKADYFTTCDDRLLKKAEAIQGLGCKVVRAQRRAGA